MAVHRGRGLSLLLPPSSLFMQYVETKASARGTGVDGSVIIAPLKFMD